MKPIRRFDVVLVDFGVEMIKGEQAGVRPAIVVQNDIGNVHSSTTIVIPLTKNIKKLNQPTHTLIVKDKNNGLSCDSVMLAEAIRQVSKGRIKGFLGSITKESVKLDIKDALYANFMEV